MCYPRLAVQFIPGKYMCYAGWPTMLRNPHLNNGVSSPGPSPSGVVLPPTATTVTLRSGSTAASR